MSWLEINHTAEEWWALLEIPKTEKEWEDAASNPYIPPTSAKSETEKSKGKEPAKTTDKPQKAPDPRHGKRIRDLHVREMKGCLSASKIGLPEYLTGRIRLKSATSLSMKTSLSHWQMFKKG